MATDPSTLDRLVERCGQLYSLPVVAVRVLQLTESPSVDVRALKECIENDPALTSKILRVVNSSLFGLTRQVSDLNQALALLGINPLKLLVLGFSLPDSLFVDLNGDLLRRYWHRTLIKAVAARELSKTVWRVPGDEAFIAGLLQDLGLLVLLQQMGEPYARLLDRALAKAPSVAAVENEVLGFDHFTLSSRLLHGWALPQEIVAAVGAGTDAGRLASLERDERTLAQILHLADSLSSLLAENRADLLPGLIEAGKQYRNISEEHLTRLVETLGERVDQLAEVLSLELPGRTEYTAVLVSAHARLSEVAANVARQMIRTSATGSFAAEENLLGEVKELAATAERLAAGKPLSATQGLVPVQRSPAAKSVSELPGNGERSMSTATATSRAEHVVNVTGVVDFVPAPVSSPPRRPAKSPPQHAGGVDPELNARLATAVTACRKARAPLSLILAEIDHYAELCRAHGPLAAERWMGRLRLLCDQMDYPQAFRVQTRDRQLAIILPHCDRRGAVEYGNELLRLLRQAGDLAESDDALATATISIGVSSVALPPKNFPAADLIRSAERCLAAAQLSGGNTVKSIEIY